MEKHKDYVVRAAKHHQVEAQKKLIQDQIANKNDDEYHIDMAHARKNKLKGVTVVETLPMPKLLPHEADDVQLADTRIMQARTKTSRQQVQFVKKNAQSNLNLLRTKLNIETKKIAKLQKELSFVGAATSMQNAKHTVFVQDEQKMEQFNPSKFFNTDPSLAGNVHNRPRKQTLANVKPVQQDINSSSMVSQTIKMYDDLEKHMQRAQALRNTIRDVELALTLSTERSNIDKVLREEGASNANFAKQYQDVVGVKLKQVRKS